MNDPEMTALDYFLELAQPGLIRDIGRIFGCPFTAKDTERRWIELGADARKELYEMRSQLEKYRQAEMTA